MLFTHIASLSMLGVCLLACGDVLTDYPALSSQAPGGGAGLGGGGMAAAGPGSGTAAGVAGLGGNGGAATSFAGIAGLSGSGGLAGSASLGGSGSSGGVPSGGSGGVPSEGQALYDASCKLCHGEQGAGSPIGPELQHPVRDYASWVVRNGRTQTTYPKPMDKWGQDKLSDMQLLLIFDYLSKPPQPTSGQALFLDYCSNCHGTDARGGPTGRNLLNEVDKIEPLVRDGKNGGQFQLRKDFMPSFPSTTLSDSELKLVRDYVDSL
jgi:mono/diheme cytochrome c family protein